MHDAFASVQDERARAFRRKTPADFSEVVRTFNRIITVAGGWSPNSTQLQNLNPAGAEVAVVAEV